VSEIDSGGIFVSYRRQDARHVAGRLFDRLADRFGKSHVFMDVVSIEPGLEFADAIEEAVSGCDVLLALIGQSWLGAVDEHGRRRLDNPDDLVLLEVTAALDQGVRVIPVLLDGTSAPRRDELPEVIAGLIRRNWVRLDHETFDSDVGGLMDVLDRIIRPDSGRGRSRPTGIAHSNNIAPTSHSLIPHRLVTTIKANRKWVFKDAVKAVLAVVFSPEGHLLASASTDQSVRLWNSATGHPVGQPLTGHTHWVRAVAFSPDGHLLASASDDKTVRLWDPATGHRVGQPLIGHTGWVMAVAFSPDGHLLASASADQTVRLWDPATGHRVGRPLIGHTDRVRAVAFSPDGHLLASASDDKTVRVWGSEP
jgi:hypothetical protein